MSLAKQSGVVTKEYYVKVPKTKKRFHALKFHATNESELKWNKAEMLREANQFSVKQEWENLPKTGAGSEFNRENKELSRRKKFGWATKSQSVDDLPWLLTFKDENSKERQFKGKKTISDNSSYYVFIHNTDGGFDAHPIEDWYAFAPHKTYRTLNIDEAEEEFANRHKILNKYAIMANKRRGENGDKDATGEDTESKKSKRAGGPRSTRSAFSLTGDGDDEWGGGGDDDDAGGRGDDDDDDMDADDMDNDEKDKKKTKKKAKGNDDGEDNAQFHEDSDDGDEDGREQDYDDDDIHTDDDDDLLNDENKAAEEEIGVDQEEAIISLQRDEDLDESEEDNEDDDDDDETLTAEGKEYKKLMKAANKIEEDLSKDSTTKKSYENDSFGSSDSSEIEDPDNDPTVVSTLLLDRKKLPTSFAGILSSNQSEPSQKRKATDEQINPIKKRSMTASALPTNYDDGSSSSLSGLATNSSTSLKTSQSAASFLPHEDEVRKYLQRKPMTTKEILIKLKKRSTVSKEKLFENLSAVLKKLTDSKLLKFEEVNGVKYLSLVK